MSHNLGAVCIAVCVAVCAAVLSRHVVQSWRRVRCITESTSQNQQKKSPEIYSSWRLLGRHVAHSWRRVCCSVRCSVCCSICCSVRCSVCCSVRLSCRALLAPCSHEFCLTLFSIHISLFIHTKKRGSVRHDRLLFVLTLCWFDITTLVTRLSRASLGTEIYFLLFLFILICLSCDSSRGGCGRLVQV